MAAKRKERPVLVITEHRALIDGKVIIIDPREYGIPERCKLAWAEMTTGVKHELVKTPE